MMGSKGLIITDHDSKIKGIIFVEELLGQGKQGEVVWLVPYKTFIAPLLFSFDCHDLSGFSQPFAWHLSFLLCRLWSSSSFSSSPPPPPPPHHYHYHHY